MKRFLCILACLALLVPAAGAVTVLTSDDTSARMEAARAQMKGMAVGSYGMIPITDVPDGSYAVAVQSSSPYFKIVEATLRVRGGEMFADIVIGSASYDRMRVGAEEIQGARSDGRTTFRIPVPALNQPIECAAHSVKRDQWYDRALLVDAASLPEGTLAFALPDYALIDRAMNAYMPEATPEAPARAVEPMAVRWPDGDYAIEVTLTGGSGRASVSSPTRLIVREGRAWARLLWSSAYYDYMLIDGARYDNLATDGGNSTFEIPIPEMDAPVEVIADTTAMGDPVEIRYQLTFYAESVGDVRQVPQEAAKYVLAISLAIIVLGGILNHFVKKGRK